MTKLERCTCNDSLERGIILPCPVHDINSSNYEEPEEDPLTCPICEEVNLIDISPTRNNGILGSGGYSTKIVDLHKCPNCKIVLSND